jgi:2-polyprenyl-3-methyl-5-hydroxy-6-metoxy-1,4-benzoquinol methylase
MPINFHEPKNSFSYAKREADSTWLEQMEAFIDWKDKIVADIGCGGGIYSNALVRLGAAKVFGIDFSPEIIREAKQNYSHERIVYKVGQADQTGLDDESVDVVLSRALIHHLTELSGFFSEMMRILKPNGTVLIQNRSPEDCFLPGSDTHIRGYFFEKYPRLREIEEKRRHSDKTVREALAMAGMHLVKVSTIWEVRKVYQTLGELKNDLQSRLGRSILHELSDNELAKLITFILDKLEHLKLETIVEQDRWTIWVAQKNP